MNASFRKLCRNLHLWLGLLSGIVVMVVCATGGLYVFKDEIEDATEPWRFVKAEQRPLLLPEQLIAMADEAAGGLHPSAITYGEATDAVRVDYWNAAGGSKAVFLNPYTGQVIKVVKHEAGEFDFFSFILRGHRTLWLPRAAGNAIVDYGVLVFSIVLLTGLFIWWPRRWSRKAVRSRLTIRRPFRWSRLDFDLHNVVGFYALLPLFVLCVTGLIFGLPWFARTVYSFTSGGRTLQAYTLPVSDTLKADVHQTASLNRLYMQMRHEAPGAVEFYLTIPQSKSDIYRVSVVHQRKSYYRTDNLFFDQYTLSPLQGTGSYAGHYDKVPWADRLMRMNLEIHDGRMWGIGGKIVMFLAAVVGTSLPVTGFLLWRKRTRPKQRRM